MEVSKLQDEMNRTELFCLKGIKTGDVCHYLLSEKVGMRRGIKAMLRALYHSLFAFCECTVQGVPTTVSLFSNSYNDREDHRRAFDSVTELIDGQLKVTPSGRKFAPSQLKGVFLPLIWTIQLRKTSSTLAEKMFLASNIYSAYADHAYVRRQMKKMKLSVGYLLTYCDVMPVDCFFVQKFRAEGAVAVTLQHGSFSKTINSWAFSASKSDYFLAESPAAVDSARSLGCRAEMIPVGSPHQLTIDDPKIPDRFEEAETVGVIMNSDNAGREDGMRADNAAMLRTVGEYCAKEHKKMLVKFHPKNDPDDYKSYIDGSIAETYGRDITVDAFGELSDVVVVSSSTVFTTMLKRRKPVFIFVREGADPEAFPKTDHLKFSTADMLKDGIGGIAGQEYWKKYEECRSYILCGGCYRDNYIAAFRKIGINTVS